jgi:hypothetical protein
MKHFFAVAGTALICALSALAGDIKIEVKMAKDKDSTPTDTFATDCPKICAFFTTKGATKGNKFRGVWIAEDVGDAAPQNTKIDEVTLTADEDDYYGMFSLTKPTSGWPEGKYRVDIYIGDDIASSAKFTVGKSDKTNESEENSEE